MMRERLKEEGEIKNWLVKKLYGVDLKEPGELKDPQKAAKAEGKYRNAITAMQNIKAYKRTNEGHGGCRYSAMNLHSHFFRGSVEFRLKEGTVDFEEIVFWAMFCGWVVESATRLKDEDVVMLSGIKGWMWKCREWLPGGLVGWVEGKLAYNV
jgi:hypothetical protein